MRKLRLAFLAALIVVVVSAALWIMNAHSSQDRMLGEKITLLEQRFDCHDYIIESSGGYDETTGRYYYEFVWYYNWKDACLLVYDQPEDLTAETLSLVEVQEMPEFERGG